MLRANDRRGSRRGSLATAGLVLRARPRSGRNGCDGLGARPCARAIGEAAALARGRARNEELLGERGKAAAGTRIESCGPRAGVPFAHAGHRPPEVRARSRAPRADNRGSHQPSRRLAPGAERLVPALRPPGVGDHGARPGEAPSRDQDVQRARDHGSDRDDPRRSDPARLPGLGPFGSRRLVHRPVLRRPRRRASMRATTAGMRRTRTARSSSMTPSSARALARPEPPHSTGDQLRTYRLALITDPGYSDVPRRPADRDRGQGRAR